MTFKEEMKERTEVIEKLLVKYLPKADAGDIPPFRRRRKRNRAVYGSNGDDPYLFPGAR